MHKKIEQSIEQSIEQLIITMTKIRLKIDSRRTDSNNKFPIMISIAKNGKTAYISTGISLRLFEWNSKSERCVNMLHKDVINKILRNKLLEVERKDLECALQSDYDEIDAYELKSKILGYTNTPEQIKFMEYFNKFALTKSASNQKVYNLTYKCLKKYLGELEDKTLISDINLKWVNEFDSYLNKCGLSINTKFFYLSNIRSVCSNALKDGLIKESPFAKFKIKTTDTEKRSLDIDLLRHLLRLDLKKKNLVMARDYFMLIFLLRGINMVDLSELTTIEFGRVKYVRSKTHKKYSIKVEPEALEIIEKYRGLNKLVNVSDRYADYNQFTININRNLTLIAKNYLNANNSDCLKTLSTYWARHTWATIAHSLDIPKDVIAAGLGHGGNTVTDIYINFDESKVDRANRIVIDWVYYGIKNKWEG